MEFKDEIKAIEQTAEQTYVRALTKLNSRRLGKQEAKLKRCKRSPAPKRQGFNKPYFVRKQTTSRARGANRTKSLGINPATE